MLRRLIKASDAAKKAWRQTSNFWRSFDCRNDATVKGTYDIGLLAGSYWISSERGVYLLEKGKITWVVPVPCYGFALAGDHFYLSSYHGHYTALLQGRRASLYELGAPFGFKELYGYETAGSNERIHQIFAAGKNLWAANTGRNTLLQVSLPSGSVTGEWPLFYDAFAQPILHDNHHINSVSVYGDLLLFVAYRAGQGSLLGYIHQGQATGFAYKNRGVHDIFLGRNDLVFCDTFGSGAPDHGGWAVDKQGPIDPEFFQRSPGRIVRGVAGDDAELLLGHSHKGERRKRFDGHGSVMVVKGRKVAHEIELPCAQVYQIARYDGSYLAAPESPRVADVDALLRGVMGPAAYQVAIEPLPVKAAA